MSNQHSGELKAAILAAVARPDGMATAEVTGYTVQQVGRMVQKLQNAGLVVRAPMPGKVGRYFDTLPRAEEYAKRKAPTTQATTAKAQRWADDAPAITPANVKRTEAATPRPRFAPDPEDSSWKLFSTMRPGRYLEAA